MRAWVKLHMSQALLPCPLACPGTHLEGWFIESPTRKNLGCEQHQVAGSKGRRNLIGLCVFLLSSSHASCIQLLTPCAQVRKHKCISLVFTDIVGWTSMSKVRLACIHTHAQLRIRARSIPTFPTLMCSNRKGLLMTSVDVLGPVHAQQQESSHHKISCFSCKPRPALHPFKLWMETWALNSSATIAHGFACCFTKAHNM